jgi:hypothetical protein
MREHTSAVASSTLMHWVAFGTPTVAVLAIVKSPAKVIAL